MSLEEEDFHCSYLRCNFSIMFLLEGLVIAMFALFATYNDQSESSDIESILLNGLAILGFGLLLIEHEKNIKQVFVFIFLAFSLNIQLFPLFGQLWKQVYNGDIQLVEKQKIKLNYEYINISGFMTISFLISMWGTISKIGILTTNLLILVFSIGFSLNYETNKHIFQTNDSQTTIYDDFLVSRIFLFSSGFGLIFLLIRRFFKKPVNQVQQKQVNQWISLLPLLGTIFIIPLLSSVIDPRISGTRSVGSLNIYFALSGSILGALSMAAITKSIIHVEDIKFSVFSGIIQIGIIGNFIIDPFIAILIGFVSGSFSNLIYNFFFYKLKDRNFVQGNAIIFVFLFNSILGAFLITPVIIKVYEVTQRYNNISGISPAYHMIYSGISLGIGAGFGLLCGIGQRCLKQNNVYSDEGYLNPAQEEEDSKVEVPQQSSGQI